MPDSWCKYLCRRQGPTAMGLELSPSSRYQNSFPQARGKKIHGSNFFQKWLSQREKIWLISLFSCFLCSSIKLCETKFLITAKKPPSSKGGLPKNKAEPHQRASFFSFNAPDSVLLKNGEFLESFIHTWKHPFFISKHHLYSSLLKVCLQFPK